MATITNADLREDIQALRKDMSELINNGLPANYVQLRAHEAALHAHDDRILVISSRVSALEQKSDTGIAWANQEHSSMRKEWAEDIKQIAESMVKSNEIVVRMTVQINTVIKILVWALGIVMTILVSIIIAVLTHHL